MGQPAKPIDPDYDPVRAAIDRALATAPRHVETEEERAAVEAAMALDRPGDGISGAEMTAMIEGWRTGPWPPPEE